MCSLKHAVVGIALVSACAGSGTDAAAPHALAADSGRHAADEGGAGTSGGVADSSSSSAGTRPTQSDSGGTPAARPAQSAGTSGSTGPRAGQRAAAAGSGGSSAAAGSTVKGAAGGAAPAAPFKGVANSPCAARTALNVSWYYNWTQNENEACADGRGGSFVPMIWGHTGAEQDGSGIQSAIKALAGRGYDTVLGFNEPDNASQSNIPVDKAIALWPSFDAAGLRVGSPGTQANQNPGQAWFKDFVSRLQADKQLRADFLAIHWYGWNAGSCDAKASQLESYLRWAEGLPGNRPIWITEWGCLNASASDDASVIAFFQAAVAMFTRHRRLERYAWYPWASHCGLNNSDGSLTELGKVFAALPASRQ